MPISRRNFLKTTSTIIGGFSLQSFSSPIITALAPDLGNDNVLVLIQLNGGNDGLNTVIPVGDYSNYYRVRSNIAVPENKILPLTGYGDTGLHPSLGGIHHLYNEGRVRIIQSVGYPNPSYSHFRASDIWASGSDAQTVVNTGWSGRYLEHEYPGFPSGYPNENMPDPLAIQIGNSGSLLLQGVNGNMGMSINDPNAFYNTITDPPEPIPGTFWGEQLEYIRLISQQTSSYSSVIREAADKVKTQGSYPDLHLAHQLKIVARLIKGGLKTKVYLVSTYGFDTHANQVDMHGNILQQVSDSVLAFMNDLKGLGIEDRVMGMTYSEFGRRIHSNASAGTDHGAAAPMFVFGKQVKPGITGTNPEIALELTQSDNIPYQFDFRSVYRTLLTDWFCKPVDEVDNILFDNFQHLSIIGSSSCTIALSLEDRDVNGRPEPDENLLKVYPNPFVYSTTISYKSKGSKILLQLIDGSGKVVKVISNDKRNAGLYNITIDTLNLPVGMYYVRMQDVYKTVLKAVVKVR